MLSGDTEITFDENKDNALVSDRAYIQDREVKSFILTPGKGFSGEPVSGDATYEVAMKWEAYHTLPEGMEYIVTRWDFDLITFVDGKATDESGTKEKYIEVYRGRDLGISHTFTLTEEENKSAHNYVYYLQIAPVKSSSDNPMTQAKEKDADGNLKDGIIKTNPSIKEVSFISSISATDGDKALSDSIVLNWTYNEESITAAGLDVTKVSVHILKRTSTDATYTDISEGTSGVSGTSYTDEDVESDNTYNYILKPYYNDSTSPYNGAQSTETDKRATGSLLGTVKEIEATINTSNTSIDVSWSKVENAHGYVVYYREKGTADWTEGAVIESADTTVCTLSSNLTAGTRYIFTVSAVDNNKKAKASESITAEGEILGGVKGLKATGDSDIKSDSIVLTWDEVENATSYFVSIYDDEGTNFFNETVHGTTYTLSATSDIIKAYSTAHEYALSRKYSFTVIPMVGSMKPLSEPTKVTGYWVMPPKNITATKAQYRDLVILSWESVLSAKGYRVYRREYNSDDDWTFVSFSTETTASLGFDGTEKISVYEYSVSTVIGTQESPLQQYFEDDTNYAGYKANVGAPLLNPMDVYGALCGNNIVKLSFTVPEFVDSFKVTPNGRDTQTFTLSSSSSKKEGEAGYSSYNDGIFTCYVEKPLIELNPELQIRVKSYNANAPLSTNNTSFGYNLNIVPTKDAINSYEIVNLANSILKSAIAEVNTEYNGDWWIPYDTQPYSSQDRTIYAEGCATKTFGGMASNAYIKLTNYSGKNTQICLNGEIGIYPDTMYNNLAGYLDMDPPEYITTSPSGNHTITVTLPYTLGTAAITYNDKLYLDGSQGSYTVTFNGKTETVDHSQVSVRPY